MSEIEYIKKKIVDVCDIIPENHTFTKTYINQHEGIYPVYSATVGEPFGYVNEYTQTSPMLVVVNYGNSGTIYYVGDEKYSLGRNACGLRVKKEYEKVISLQYIKYVAESQFKQLAKGWGLKNLNQKMVKETEIKIPVFDGSFSYQTQEELVNKYKIIDEQKKLLSIKVDELRKVSVIIPEDESTKWVHLPVTDLFYPKGGNALFTKTWVSKNKGEIPLYSGTTTGEYARISEAEYSGEYLTWCIDGLAGYIMYHNEEFSLTCHRGVLIPTDKCKDIDLRYVKYVLEPIFRKRKKGREGELGKNEYTSLKPIAIKRMKDTIPIPIKSDGTYDIQKQKSLANRYEQIEEIKKNISNRITELIEIVVS